MRAMDVRAWLFRHGFDARRGKFVAAYGDSTVHVHILSDRGRTWMTSGPTEMPLREFGHADLMLDGQDMLIGAGLRGLFLDHIRAGEAAPAWFPDDYAVNIGQGIVPDPTDTRALLVVDWLRRNGFEKAPSGLLQSRYEDSVVTVEVRNTEAITRIEFETDSTITSRTDLDSVFIGRDGMLRGAGLDYYFLKEIDEGGQVPSWFPPRFVRERVADRSNSKDPKPR